MAQFPVENEPALYEGINYLLSGPAGLGQNFEGFSAYELAYLRPTIRQPFTLPGNSTLQPAIYLQVPISNAAPYGTLPTSQIEVTFATPFANAPFQPGDTFSLTGTNPSFYDDRYRVFSCTASTAVLTTRNGFSYNWPAYVSDGTIVRDFSNTALSGDNNARVTIFGPTDKAFISCQNVFSFDYSVVANTGASMQVVSSVERWVGTPTNASADPGVEDYLFNFDQTISQETFKFDNITANGTGNVNSIFTTVIDSPSFGYYWYFNNIYFYNVGGLTDPTATTGFFNIRGVQPRAGAAGTYNGCTVTTVTGSGSGGVVDIELFGTDDVYTRDLTVTIDTPGSGYVAGDYVKITGDQLGGTTPDNDLTLRVFAVTNAEQLYPGNVYLGVRSMTAQVVKE
jgi:hypothetical protein